MSSTITEALREAIAKATEDEIEELRVYLAGLLAKDAATATEAFELSCLVLASDPGDLGALEAAAVASRTLSLVARAERYERVIDALTSVREETRPRADVVPLRAVPRATEGSTDVAEVEPPQLRLHDVAGMALVKHRLELSFLGPMRHPELRQLYRKSLRGGLLLWGPPGCGKTFLARAVAGELGARFINVGLDDVLDMYIGQSERNLAGLFAMARRAAPCVLFIDEIDALGQKRSQQSPGTGRNVVAQLLTELDGVGERNEGVFVLAATNHPWDVDPALRRPGRFDRTLLVLPPDEAARAAILTNELSQRPVDDVDIETMARRTAGFSGADLVHVCESAAELALADSINTGTPRSIGPGDFRRVLKEIAPSTNAWIQMARNHAEFGGDRGTYDDLMTYLRRTSQRS
ncbi:MAG: ATP-binding protein [Myxococcota bacterium]